MKVHVNHGHGHMRGVCAGSVAGTSMMSVRSGRAAGLITRFQATDKQAVKYFIARIAAFRQISCRYDGSISSLASLEPPKSTCNSTMDVRTLHRLFRGHQLPNSCIVHVQIMQFGPLQQPTRSMNAMIDTKIRSKRAHPLQLALDLRFSILPVNP